MKYIEALKAGKEIVIVSSNDLYYSSIFYYKDNVIYTFSRAFGVLKRTEKEISLNDLRQHFENMEKENAFIFVRG